MPAISAATGRLLPYWTTRMLDGLPAEILPKLLFYPHPRLRIVCEPVDPEYLKAYPEQFAKLLDEMWAVMAKYNGVGLAAPQIGVQTRAICVKIQGGCEIEVINPVLQVSKRHGKFQSDEGCLSWPGHNLIVTRHIKARVTGLDRYGKPVTFGGKMQQAAALQHEVEHLDGINIADYRSS